MVKKKQDIDKKITVMGIYLSRASGLALGFEAWNAVTFLPYFEPWGLQDNSN